MAIESCKGVFQPDAELADDTVGSNLLRILIQREMSDLDASAIVADMPPSPFVFRYVNRRCAAEPAFVKCIGNDLTNAVFNAPVLKKCLDIEVE